MPQVQSQLVRFLLACTKTARLIAIARPASVACPSDTHGARENFGKSASLSPPCTRRSLQPVVLRQHVVFINGTRLN